MGEMGGSRSGTAPLSAGKFLPFNSTHLTGTETSTSLWISETLLPLPFPLSLPLSHLPTLPPSLSLSLSSLNPSSEQLTCSQLNVCKGTALIHRTLR